MTKELARAIVAVVVIGLLTAILVVLVQPSAPAKPSTSDIITCEMDRAGGNHPDPCPTN